MKFVNLWVLALTVPAAVLWIFLQLALRRKKERLMRTLLGAKWNDPAACSLSHKAVFWKSLLQLLSILLLIVGASQPYFREKELTVSGKYRDIMVLFDVSRSMRAADLPPSRMEQAKYLLREVISAYPADRFGIIPFAGTAFVSCPLTGDHHTLLQAVDELDPGSVPLGGTNLAAALQTAEKAMKNIAGEHSAILLLTDGDELTGDAAKEISKLKEEGIPLIVAGFGSPDAAAPIPDENGKIIHSASGEIAGSKLNEALLRRLAEESSGLYLRSTVGDTGITQIKSFISSLNRADGENAPRRVPEDLSGIFILLAAGLLAVSLLISERTCRSKAALVLLLAAGMFSLGAQEVQEPLPDAYSRYETARKNQLAGNPQAAEIYEQLISGADTPEIVRGRAMQNRGIISHRQAREAVEKCRQQLEAQNPQEALKNISSALDIFKQGQELYEGSLNFRESGPAEANRVRNYQQLLRENELAAEMKKKIEELLKQQQQAQQQTRQAQQQNQQNQQNQQQNQQNQDKQQQNQQNQQQNQQNQQQNQQNQDKQQQNQQNQQAADKSAEAAKSAKDLEKQARELNQQKMADQAKNAAEKLNEAEKLQREGKNDQAQKKLDEAADELKSPENQPAPAPEEKDKPADRSGETPVPGEEKPLSEEKENASRQLEMLEDETKALQDALRRQRNMRRRKVQKDW